MHSHADLVLTVSTLAGLFDAAIMTIHAAHTHRRDCRGCPQCERLEAERETAHDAYYRAAEAMTSKPQPPSESA